MLQQLRNILNIVNSARNISEALDALVVEVSEVIQAEACSVFLLDEELGEYVLNATYGLNKKLVGKLKIKLGEGLIGLVGERAEPINIADTLQHPKFCHYDVESKEPYRAFLGIPIIYQKDLLGVLSAQKREANSFGEEEQAFLMTLVTQIADIIASSKSTGEIRKVSASGEKIVLNGMPCVPGIAIGDAVVVFPPANLEAVPDKAIEDAEREIAEVKTAMKAVADEIGKLSESIAGNISAAERALFDAYLQLLESQSLRKEIYKEIRAGNWAQGALSTVIKRKKAQFEAMDDEYLRERALYIEDLGQRILNQLQTTKKERPVYPEKTILIGEEVTPAALAEVPHDKLVGIISLKGSTVSHVAILARAIGVPTVMGISEFPVADFEQKQIIIDGYYGQAYVSPTAELLAEFEALLAQEKELNTELLSLRDETATTQDDFSISLLVNTGLAVDVGRSLRIGAEGVGLYRSEIPFMSRDHFPTEDEQKVIYQQILKIFAPRPVVMRTLDIGGDKCLPYFPVKEDNPFLGWRGIRITLDHPEIFLVQLRAMLRASEGLNNLRIMLPMISSIAEVEESMKLIRQAYNELIEDNFKIEKPQIGVMIEVPSAVYLTQELASRVDFLSVGSNDLTQYMLAVDRNNSRVANLFDSFHPAVLKALMQIVVAAHREKKPVSVCGEMAGDPGAAILLLAMGYDALSMNPNQVLKIKWLIRKLSMEKAQQLLYEVMLMDDPVEIRYFMENAIEEFGAAALIRAGG